ncbi:MAG: nucleotidyltransferase family protein [Candidatus Omnitrophica bacterium]|nr:nucleotidyltransferase family protein [Candidatus Omnitrophota bacterium]
MNTFEYQLQQVIQFLHATKIEYAIIGGVAVSLYGDPRMTQDIDVNIILDQEDLPKILQQSKKYGFAPAVPDFDRFVKEVGVLLMKFSKKGITGKFDFVIAQNPIEFAGIKRAKVYTLFNLEVKVVTPEDLLLHKLLSDRPRDHEDARGIIMRQGKKLKTDYIFAWLRKIEKVCPERQYLKEFKKLCRTIKTILPKSR